MTAIVAKKTLNPTPYGRYSEIGTLYTVTAAKTFAGSITVQNTGSATKRFTLAVSGIAAATEDLALLGNYSATGFTSLPLKNNIVRTYGSGATAFVISDDYRTYSLDGGATWSAVVADTYFNISTFALKLKYISSGVIELYPLSIGTFAAYSTNPFTLTQTGIGTLFLNNIKAFMEGFTLNTPNSYITGFIPYNNSTTTTQRVYGSEVYTSIAAGKTLILATSDTVSSINNVIPIDNSTSAYSGFLDVLDSSNNYRYFTTLSDSTPTYASITSTILTDATTVNRICYGASYSLVVTNNNKACLITNYVAGVANPAFGALSALPGSITAADVEYVMNISNTYWLIVTITGAKYRSSISALSWTTMSPVAPINYDSNLDSGLYVATNITYNTWFDSTIAAYFNSDVTVTITSGYYSANLVNRYNITSFSIDTLALEYHDIPANTVVELTGRTFPANAVIKVATYDNGTDKGGLNIALYGIES